MVVSALPGHVHDAGSDWPTRTKIVESLNSGADFVGHGSPFGGGLGNLGRLRSLDSHRSIEKVGIEVLSQAASEGSIYLLKSSILVEIVYFWATFWDLLSKRTG